MKILIAAALLLGVNHLMAQQEVDIPPQQNTTRMDTLKQDVFLGNEQNALSYDTANQEVLMDTIPVTDGFYQANNLEDAVPFAYPKVNMKNIRFYKRVWRDIDLSNEENYIYAIPGASLIEAIMKGINEGKLTPYSPEDDSFKTKMTASEGVARFADSVLVPIFDEEGNQIDAQMALNEFNPERVTKFRIKEDIFFDKQRGRLETRIIGVAPLMDISSSAELAESVGSTPAFWLYFPQLRYTLVKVDVSDPDRGLYDMSMDDLFVQRKFASTIIRESSPSAMRQEAQYAENALQQLQEAQQIEDKLETYKERLWSAPKGINQEELENYQPPVRRQNNTPSTSNPSSTTPTTTAEEETGLETESQQTPEQQQQPIEETEGLE
ncbi:type IX secretion system ring subunit PorN/GldN [Sphingobacterium chuzhouense]|uniref:Gliding motility protein GldN n=1 Tax=Sphingobacterium chuzhouense TaxID=1742264 RepID=A0ABR7XST6_9SPHI|nr:gliding motility protein GldN [Sphingobacterium chuzhouense]MBD1422235.1 gliding motility protein GldN [Sphingobacterium chuzhouense]